MHCSMHALPLLLLYQVTSWILNLPFLLLLQLPKYEICRNVSWWPKWLHWSLKEKVVKRLVFDLWAEFSHRYVAVVSRSTLRGSSSGALHLLYTTGAINMSDAGIYCQEAKKTLYFTTRVGDNQIENLTNLINLLNIGSTFKSFKPCL